jgi:dTDP-4-amino-4,6-dideoxygalactose transaminase
MNIPFAKPCIDSYINKEFLNKVNRVLSSGKITNDEKVIAFEDGVKDYLKVKNAVAVSSCTSGLILTQKLLGFSGKEILIPSFTFSATPISSFWNNCKIKFIDCDRETFNISIDDLQNKISKNTGGIIPVHIFGNPCEVKAISEIAEDYKVPVIYDAAHALGSVYHGKSVGGFGDAEVFSFSPTKIITTMEGGVISTDNMFLASGLRKARCYGNHEDYQVDMAGLNARLNEVSALLGLEMLGDIDTIISNRNCYADLYKKRLNGVRGVSFQRTEDKCVQSFKDFAILINAEEFGMSRDDLADVLLSKGIGVKKYFNPPCHRLRLFWNHFGELPNTDFVSDNVLCLPIYNYMDEDVINRVCDVIKSIQ